MDTLQIVHLVKLMVVGIVLLAASIMDIKYRRIPDRFWVLMLIVAGPLLIWEMILKGGGDNIYTFLALGLPLAGLLFIMYGYPELKEVLKGKITDILFFLIYFGALAGGVMAFVLGDRGLFSPIAVSFIFMMIYFFLYSVPIGGTRLIHGGADAKCLISLAALFPWYVMELPFQIGPFYQALAEIPSIGYIFPIHLSVFFNGAVITGAILLIYLPIRNLIKGEFTLRSFTTYKMDVDDLEGRHVWVLMENNGSKEKKDPTEKVIRKLKRRGENRVLVTPKIPFILSLTAGFAIQMVVGNIVGAMFMIFS